MSWLPALDGWLVTRFDMTLAVMRDPDTYTVDDPRFSTARVIGPSMLSLDGAEHAAHRGPFVTPFRVHEVDRRFAIVAGAEADRLIDALAPQRAGELRRRFAGPLAAAVVASALGLRRDEVPMVLDCYDAIVAAVTEITAGRGGGADGRAAFGRLSARLGEAIDAGGSVLDAPARALDRAQVISNAAVLLFGGIETTEGMISNAVLHLLEDPARAERVLAEPTLLSAAIEESLRLEPAAAVIDRYATRDTVLGDAQIEAGALVRVSLAAANRDPAVFADPDRFRFDRAGARRHLTFAHGPHVCLGVHLARLEARAALASLLRRLPRLRLDPDRPAAVRGLVFRKPPALHVLWD